jgi:predicted nucleic acid-binding protein
VTAVALVDSSVLVYVHDSRDKRKQRIAAELLQRRIAEQSVVLAFQSVIEFYAAVTRPPIRLAQADATRETEELLLNFSVLYPTEDVVRSALRATSPYQLSWYDAMMWAYADTNGIDEILSEDFQHGRLYGGVRVTNPFV